MNTTSSRDDNPNTVAYVLIIIGSYFLLKKLGWLPNIFPLIADWWSLLLIGLGIFILIRNGMNKNS